MIYIFISAISGILGGMGLGGGILLIPMLKMVSDYNQVELQLYNLLFFLSVASVSIPIHIKNGLVDKNVNKKAIFFGIIGVIVGSYFALKIDVNILQKMFGAFLILMGLNQFFAKK